MEPLAPCLGGRRGAVDAPVRWLAFHQHQDAPLLPSLQEQRLVPDSLARRSSTVVPTTLDSVFEQVELRGW